MEWIENISYFIVGAGMPLKHQALLERLMEWILQIFGIAISNPFPSSFPFFILPKLPLYPMF